MVRVTSAAGVPPISAIMARVRRPSTTPTISAPPNEITKSIAACPTEICAWVVSAGSRMPKIEIAAASFSSASPSTSLVRRVAAPISRKMLATADGSVLATIAPSVRHTTSGMPANGYSAKPIAAVLSTTATIASSRTVAASCARRRTSIAREPWNTRIGRKIIRNASLSTGKSSSVRAAPSNALVKELRSRTSADPPSTIPTRASRTVSGIARRRATGCTAHTTTSSRAIASSTAGRPTIIIISLSSRSWMTLTHPCGNCMASLIGSALPAYVGTLRRNATIAIQDRISS